jgi:opacity protein-like surface antigen
MKLRFFFLLFSFAAFGSLLRAQHLPIYAGHSEMSTSGFYNQGRLSLNVRFGHYVENLIQVGVYADFHDSSFYTRFGAGGFILRNFDTPSYLIPYVGASLGYGQIERLSEDNNGVELQFLAGIRYFISDNVSINTEFHAGVSSDDTFLDDNEVDSIDLGVRFGLSFSW